jgi:spore germination protein GerM
VKIYLIAINDNGASGPKIGCNDSAVPVTLNLPATTSPLTDSTKQLLSMKSRFYGESGLYNVFYQSNLTVDSVIISNGKATYNLRGTLSLGGECDDPRVEAQLKYTALQFSTVKTVEIFVNGKKLSSVLGGQ